MEKQKPKVCIIVKENSTLYKINTNHQLKSIIVILFVWYCCSRRFIYFYLEIIESVQEEKKKIEEARQALTKEKE